MRLRDMNRPKILAPTMMSMTMAVTLTELLAARTRKSLLTLPSSSAQMKATVAATAPASVAVIKPE